MQETSNQTQGSASFSMLFFLKKKKNPQHDHTHDFYIHTLVLEYY